MNSEQPKTPEQLPAQAEIKSIFDSLLPGQEYKQLRLLNDEKGITLYEIEVTLEDGEKLEFDYRRANYNYRDPSLNPEGRFSASIHATYYDKDGMPYTGKCVANYLDGEWQIIP